MRIAKTPAAGLHAGVREEGLEKEIVLFNQFRHYFFDFLIVDLWNEFHIETI